MNVPLMKNIEAAIGEADPQPLAPPFGEPQGEVVRMGDDLLLGGERGVRQDLAAQFREVRAFKDGLAELTNFQHGGGRGFGMG